MSKINPYAEGRVTRTELAKLAATVASGMAEYLVKTGYGVSATQKSIARESVNVARLIFAECGLEVES